MPGVYVHSVKELGWVPTHKNSLIAIPGAYWLCHKQNIYKFIFRYHRGVRYDMGFICYNTNIKNTYFYLYEI